MAYVGEKYEHDVFISYAWALEAVEDDSLRDWCRYVADRIFSNLRRRFNAHGRFRAYLDRDAAKNGQDLDEVLPEAVKNSAVFVAFVSDYYQSDWCTKEVNWFCERFKDNPDDFAKHVFILNIMPTADTAWPDGFKGLNSKRLYDVFYDGDGQPLDIDYLQVESLQRALLPAIKKASAAIGDKLETIKQQLDARAEYESSRRWPCDPVLYFEGESQDKPRWAECARVLETGKNVVVPGFEPVPANEQSNAKTTYAATNGVVMFRARSKDNIVLRVWQAYHDLRIINGERIAKSEPKLPLVLLDDVDEPPPSDIKPFKIRRVIARGDFAPKLNEALFDA